MRTCIKKHSLFKDFVSALLELHRHIEIERLGGLVVDHQLELNRGLYGKLTRFRALKDVIDIGRRAPKIIRYVISIGQQTTEFSEETVRIDRGRR